MSKFRIKISGDLLIVISFVFITCGFLYIIYSHITKLENFDNQKIAITTYENRNENYINFHDINFQKYCDKYGYEYIRTSEDAPYIKETMPVYWKKIALVDKLLDSGKYSYVMWCDSDTLILNPEIKIEDIVSSEKDIYIGTDSPPTIHTLNAGIFIIKNSDTGRKFIKECLEKLNDAKCFNKTRDKIKGPWAGSCYEQGHMNFLIKTKYKECTEIVSQSLFHNTPGIYLNKPYIVHVYGPLSDLELPIIYKTVL